MSYVDFAVHKIDPCTPKIAPYKRSELVSWTAWRLHLTKNIGDAFSIEGRIQS